MSTVRCRPSRLKLSMRGVRMPCMVPNMVLRPRLSSMRKKRADQKGLPGSRDMASVKAMKARPVPWAPCREDHPLGDTNRSVSDHRS